MENLEKELIFETMPDFLNQTERDIYLDREEQFTKDEIEIYEYEMSLPHCLDESDFNLPF
jgi:hypothetical protein